MKICEFLSPPNFITSYLTFRVHELVDCRCCRCACDLDELRKQVGDDKRLVHTGRVEHLNQYLAVCVIRLQNGVMTGSHFTRLLWIVGVAWNCPCQLHRHWILYKTIVTNLLKHSVLEYIIECIQISTLCNYSIG